MATHGTDQTIVQRLLAARNQGDSRRAILASGFIVLFQFTRVLLVGVLLFVFSQHTPLLSPGKARIESCHFFLVREMPTGLAGILLASILAVAMSNASGALQLAGRFQPVMDLNALRGRPTDPANVLKVSRRMTSCLGSNPYLLGWCDGVSLCWKQVWQLLPCPLEAFWGFFFWERSILGQIRVVHWQACSPGLRSSLIIYRQTHVAYTWYVLIGSCTTFCSGGTWWAVFFLYPLRHNDMPIAMERGR